MAQSCGGVRVLQPCCRRLHRLGSAYRRLRSEITDFSSVQFSSGMCCGSYFHTCGQQEGECGIDRFKDKRWAAVTVMAVVEWRALQRAGTKSKREKCLQHIHCPLPAVVHVFCGRSSLWQRRRLVVFNDYVQFAEFSDFSDFWAMLALWVVDKPFEPVAATMRFSAIGSLNRGGNLFR